MEFYRQARDLLDEEDYDRSLHLARERLRAVPGDVPAILVLCRSWLGLGRPDEAMTAFAAIEPMNEEIARLLKLLGDAFRGQGDRERAMRCYQRSVALLSDVGELREARDSLAALAEEDDEPAAGIAGGEGFQTLTMAELYIRQGHYEGARGILQAILSRAPERLEVRRRLEEVLALINEKNNDLPIDKKSTVVHELSRWLIKLGEKRR
ncbi:MAG: tetratricopeptide repeat protein [Pseudomonadota bacterium]|nr:tetratricopeptide repeat protein [Pseudomonadota bacterium]